MLLFQRLEAGDRRACEKLVRAHIGLVLSIARRLTWDQEMLDDLVDAGLEGLLRAINRFDRCGPARFSTYAYTWVEGAVRRRRRELVRAIHLPEAQLEQERKVATAEQTLAQQLHRRATEEEIADAAQISPEQLQRLRQLPHVEYSLDDPARGDGGDGDPTTRGVLLPDPGPEPAETAANHLDRQALSHAVSHLPETDRQLLQVLYGLNGTSPLPTTEAASLLNLTADELHRREIEILAKLAQDSELRALGRGGER